MEWDKVGKLISGVAPTLGSIIGGPVGGGIGLGIGMLVKALGLKEDVSPEEVMATLQTNPEAMLKLKELESQERMHLLELQNSQLQLTLSDVQDARHHEVDLAKLGHISSYAPVIISTVIVLGFFGILYFILFNTIPVEMKDICTTMLGALGAAFTGVWQYYLGSSAGSERKTNLLALADSVKGRD